MSEFQDLCITVGCRGLFETSFDALCGVNCRVAYKNAAVENIYLSKWRELWEHLVCANGQPTTSSHAKELILKIAKIRKLGQRL